jgi:acyl carrier protein
MLKEELEQTIVELVCKYNEQPYDAQLKDQPIVNFRLDSVNAVSIVSDLEKNSIRSFFLPCFGSLIRSQK